MDSEEIEITPHMVSAGVAALRDSNFDTNYDAYWSPTPGEVVSLVFEAMMKARDDCELSE